MLIRVAITIAILIPIALAYIGVNTYNEIDDAYAQWGAADMVVGYMRDHDGKWPPDWDSLKPYFDLNNGRVGGWSYERFPSRVSLTSPRTQNTFGDAPRNPIRLPLT